jgi:catecholate siderophore receptor
MPHTPRRSVPAAIGLLLTATSTIATAQVQTAASVAEQVMPTIRTTDELEATDKDSVRATTTTIGKGLQELRDVPQSVTVVTEKLLDDRNLTTLKEALKQTSGVTFLAAEGGEEDIRLRGFSLQSSGDIFIDGMRDPAFYDRDSFNWDRLEVLRGSASMLFGRGSTGGAVNQVTKQPSLHNFREVALTGGSGDYARLLADVNIATTDSSALRVNGMFNRSDGYGFGVDKYGVAPAFRWGIGTSNDFTVSGFHLQHDNGIHYGLPWLTPGPNTGGDYLWDTPPENYYGMASDKLAGGTTQGNMVYVRDLGGGAQLRTAARVARYERDQRASAIRFAPTAQQPGRVAVTSDTFSDATQLTRGANLKVMNMDTRYLQSDYSGTHKWWGKSHAILAGVDGASEEFENLAATTPLGVSLAKPQTLVGTPDDGARIDESARILTVNRTFNARALGLYAQDLLQVTSTVKLLGGLRWDRFDGEYRNIAVAQAGNNVCSVAPATRLSRADSLLSKRVGVLYQPSHVTSWHVSYGTSFNTSGDTYQYDPGTANVAPESSRNIELGAKLDSWSGNFTTRFAAFHATKYNERNRDADTVNACNYVLSGERHVAGAEVDLAGRIAENLEIYASYSFIPVAKVDESTGAPGTEIVGSRPGLTPRHSGTLWSTYQLTSNWRIGAGINARSRDKPAGLNANSLVRAPAFVTGDLLLEYLTGLISLKANLTNITDEHYAETVYRGHYVPGKPRSLEITATLQF